MATATLKVYGIGTHGVNVDKDPLEIGDDELVLAKNVVSLVVEGESSISKRPGLGAFTTTITAGTVLGGIDVPLLDLSINGPVHLYIGRAPTT